MKNLIDRYVKLTLESDDREYDPEYYYRRDPNMCWGTAGAGIFFTCQDGTALFLLRSGKCAQPFTWGIPGGGMDEGWHRKPLPPTKYSKQEFFDTAVRETREECGSLPPGLSIDQVGKVTTYQDRGFVYKTFITELTEKQKQVWKPVSTDGETLDFKWVSLEEAQVKQSIDGKQLHFGVKYTMSKM